VGAPSASSTDPDPTVQFEEAEMPAILKPIEERRARRALSDRPVEREVASRLLQAAHLAPSCANNQPWRLIAVDDPETLRAVKDGLTRGNYWAEPAPLVVAVASRPDLDCQIPDGREYSLFGCGLATMNLILQATELGLVAHPIAGYRQREIKPALGVPDDYTVIVLIVVGHPSDDLSGLSEKHREVERGPRDRRPLDEVVSWNRFAFDDPPPPEPSPSSSAT
jgi:nitroreductase